MSFGVKESNSLATVKINVFVGGKINFSGIPRSVNIFEVVVR